MKSIFLVVGLLVAVEKAQAPGRAMKPTEIAEGIQKGG